MQTGEQIDVTLDENLLESFGAVYYDILMGEDENFKAFVEAMNDNV